MFDRYLVATSAIPHLVFTALLGLVVSTAVGFLGKRTRRERILHAGWFFGCAMASVIAGSWVMLLIHG